MSTKYRPYFYNLKKKKAMSTSNEKMLQHPWPSLHKCEGRAMGGLSGRVQVLRYGDKGPASHVTSRKSCRLCTKCGEATDGSL